MKNVIVKSIILFLFAVSLPVSSAGWWDTGYAHRMKIRILNPEMILIVNTGQLAFKPIGNINPDCSDIRIIDKEGEIVPYRVTSFEPSGSVNVEFEVEGSKADEYYYVYYGNPEAFSLQYSWEQKKVNIVLEIKENPRQRNVVSHEFLEWRPTLF